MRRRTDAALSAAVRGIGARYDQAELRLRLGADRPRLGDLTEQRLEQARRRWAAQARLLEASSHKRILERGFAIVQTGEDTLVRRAQDLAAGQAVTLLFQDSPPGQPTPARILEPAPDRQP